MKPLKKIGISVVFGLLGLFLGVWLGIFFFASAHFMRHFVLWALGIFAFVFLLDLKNLFKTNRKNKYFGLIFSTAFAGVIICGIAGVGWIIAGDVFEMDFVDSVIFLTIVPITSIVLGIFIPLRFVWQDTRISRSVGQTLIGTKTLLGMGDESQTVSDENLDKKDT